MPLRENLIKHLNMHFMVYVNSCTAKNAEYVVCDFRGLYLNTLKY